MSGHAGTDNAGELLVWPWTGILATAAGNTDSLEFHVAQHFATITTTQLQETTTSHHFLLLHSGKSWAGLRDSMSLSGQLAGGRREWQERRHESGNVYGWMAGEEDLRGGGVVGRFLRESGATARSAADIKKAEGSVAAKPGGMACEHERRLRFMEERCEEEVEMTRKVDEERRWLLHEIRELRKISTNIIPEINHEIYNENEKLRTVLNATRIGLESRMKQIEELKDWRIKLDCKMQKNALDSNLRQLAGRKCKADDHTLVLLEQQKQERKAISAKLFRLEMQLEQRKELESTIRQLNMKLPGDYLRKEEHQHLYKIMKTLSKNLDQERKRLENLNLDLMKREYENSDELQEIRQELIKDLGDILNGCGQSSIKIKRVGDLDLEPFKEACDRKYEGRQATFKAIELWLSWQRQLENQSWHPFKAVREGLEIKEVVDKDDPKLRSVRLELGNDVCNALEKALMELNEYNPIGRTVVTELWNSKEGRRVAMNEILRYMCKQWKKSMNNDGCI